MKIKYLNNLLAKLKTYFSGNDKLKTLSVQQEQGQASLPQLRRRVGWFVNPVFSVYREVPPDSAPNQSAFELQHLCDVFPLDSPPKLP